MNDQNLPAGEKIAKILRTDKDNIKNLEVRLAQVTGKVGILDRIVSENEALMRTRLASMDLARPVMANEIYNALIRRIEVDDEKVSNWLGNPSAQNAEDWQRVLDKAKNLAGSPKGFFLKLDKARELLAKEPPKKILTALQYSSVSEMLGKEDVYEIFAALRFMEGSEWLNNVFFNQYGDLKPSDFEYRQIEVRSLPQRWLTIAEKFIQKKHHNISHLKELGLIFTLPLPLDVKGEGIRNFSLILHYFNEIPFYSSLFERYAKDEGTFTKNLVSLLSGFTLDEEPPKNADRSNWLLIQRYLAKDDENDWRLLVPHLNPEALHWERAERMLTRSEELKAAGVELSFWENLNWVGDYFKTDTGIEVLASFNLIDSAMSLVKKSEMIKYLYHHQESLWNKIFSEYFGEEEMENKMKESILTGYFDI